MGYLAGIYKLQYDRIFQITEAEVEETAEIFLENARDISYKQVLPQVAKETKDLSKLDLEQTRVDSINQLNEIREEIADKWKEIIHKTTVAALTYEYYSYLLIVPTLVLLLLNLVIAAQIYAVVSFLLILLVNYDPVRSTISYYCYGVSRISNQLEDLYVLYGSLEAVITVADYRNFNCVDRKHWVYSNHHRKLPD